MLDVLQAKAGNKEAAAEAALQGFKQHQSWAGLKLFLSLACHGQVTTLKICRLFSEGPRHCQLVSDMSAMLAHLACLARARPLIASHTSSEAASSCWAMGLSRDNACLHLMCLCHLGPRAEAQLQAGAQEAWSQAQDCMSTLAEAAGDLSCPDPRELKLHLLSPRHRTALLAGIELDFCMPLDM